MLTLVKICDGVGTVCDKVFITLVLFIVTFVTFLLPLLRVLLRLPCDSPHINIHQLFDQGSVELKRNNRAITRVILILELKSEL